MVCCPGWLLATRSPLLVAELGSALKERCLGEVGEGKEGLLGYDGVNRGAGGSGGQPGALDPGRDHMRYVTLGRSCGWSVFSPASFEAMQASAGGKNFPEK